MVLAVAALEVWVVAGFLEIDARACSACRNSFAAPRNEKRPGIICPRQAAFPIRHSPCAHCAHLGHWHCAAQPFRIAILAWRDAKLRGRGAAPPTPHAPHGPRPRVWTRRR